MPDEDCNAGRPILDGHKDQELTKWKQAWEKAKHKEEQSEAWLGERISRASRLRPQQGPAKKGGSKPRP